MSFAFTIDSVDYSGYIAADGFDWERNDIDAPNSGRDMRGTMHRKIVTRKYKLTIACRPLSSTQQAQLFNALAKTSVNVTFTAPDTNSSYTGEFYNSKRSGGVTQDQNGTLLHKGTSFDLVEV